MQSRRENSSRPCSRRRVVEPTSSSLSRTPPREQSLVADVAACAELEELRVPDIERSGGTRLSQLSTTARDVLEVCAVGGASSALAPVAQLAMVEPWLLDRELRSLRAVELLRPDGSLDFVAPVVRWAILHELSSGRRSELHERWANSLASNGADDVAVVNHLLANFTRDWGRCRDQATAQSGTSPTAARRRGAGGTRAAATARPVPTQRGIVTLARRRGV